ncbi:MAG: hypothetical protein IM613_17440 [Cytophagales bacterium]|nr:hypothetical protein [Cytophagales bacterium]
MELKSYNIRGQLLSCRTVRLDAESQSVTMPSGTTFKVERDWEFTYKILKRKKIIRASGGFDGFVCFLREINDHSSPFNPCYTDIFINL